MLKSTSAHVDVATRKSRISIQALIEEFRRFAVRCGAPSSCGRRWWLLQSLPHQRLCAENVSLALAVFAAVLARITSPRTTASSELTHPLQRLQQKAFEIGLRVGRLLARSRSA